MADIVKVAIGFRGQTGAVAPEDMARVERAISAGEAIDEQVEVVERAATDVLQSSGDLQAALGVASDKIVQDLGYDNNLVGLSFTDEYSMPTVLTTNRYGELSKFAIENTLSRIPAGVLGPRHLTDMSTIATWGASDVEFYKAQYAAMATQLGAVHFSGGNSGAYTDSIWQEQGLFSFDVIFPNGIVPATSDPVPVNIWNLEVRNATRPRPVILDGLGIEGIIDGTTDGNIFIRTGVVPGVSVATPANGSVKAISLNGIKYADCCQIWCVGRNDISMYGSHESAIKTYLDMTIEAYNAHPTVDKKVLVYGYYTFGNATATQIRCINYANAYYKKCFADRFIDVLGYYMSADVWTHTGITPTAADRTAQAATKMPPSLAMDNTHYSQAANQALITNEVKPRLIALGWFKEV
ncbi:hypothetical protein [Paracoccus sp. (in: a-proteobacteria)]|uniref:hypothetical protein n=1 Tax=Paracoccus sp. TaxID=267 RepID=UPI002899CF4C|nr:hypothetical protein [Paracoccus sp. (in: a-proteobacteria)]